MTSTCGLQATKTKMRIREASLEDYGKIAALQARNGLTARTYADWSALCVQNPVYLQSDRHVPIGWVLETGAGEIGGFIGNLPLAYHLNGRDLRAAAACAWAVDPQYRACSIPLLDRFMKQDGVDLLLSTTLSAAAEAIFSAFQFCKVPTGTWDRSDFWITGYRGFAGSALKAASTLLPEVLAYPVAAALNLRDTFSEDGRSRRSDCELEVCPEFDSRFEEFWEELKSENSHILLASRTRETLAWHFRHALCTQNAWILSASYRGRIVAYAVFDRQDRPTLQLKRLRLVDFQALRGFEYALQPILDWMLLKCRTKGIHTAEVVGCWLERLRVSGTAAPYRRKMKSWVFYYLARDPELARQLEDPSVWAPSSFDGDASVWAGC